MRIGLVGAGSIGGTLAHRWVELGHEVVVSNSRGPDTLAELVAELGPAATAGTAAEAAAAGEVVVVSIPFKAYRDVPVAELAGKVVMDTNNYYPQRDGVFPELEDGSGTTSSGLLQQHLPTSRVVKVFNNIYFKHLRYKGTPKGTPGRRALPIAGDDPEARALVARLVDELGFDVVDVGPLAEGRRFERDKPAYVLAGDAAAVRAALAEG